jgi:2Fe-2S ferredoxin
LIGFFQWCLVGVSLGRFVLGVGCGCPRDLNQRGAKPPLTEVDFLSVINGSHVFLFPFAMTSLVSVTFVQSNGEAVTVESEAGLSLLEVARQHHIDLEGACEGSLACSTCHVVVDPSWYPKLSVPTDDENDMLDLAFHVTNTSRLGCQVVLSPELNGLVVTIPGETRHLVSKMNS